MAIKPQLKIVFSFKALLISTLISDLGLAVQSFADDIKFYLSLPHNNGAFNEELQGDIDCLVRTGAAWGLEMNERKCVCVRFGGWRNYPPHLSESPYHIRHEKIKFVHSHPDLGVLVDHELKFHGHVRRIVGVASGERFKIEINPHGMLRRTICRGGFVAKFSYYQDCFNSILS